MMSFCLRLQFGGQCHCGIEPTMYICSVYSSQGRLVASKAIVYEESVLGTILIFAETV